MIVIILDKMKDKNKERYPSDLSDEEWKIIKPFVMQGKNGRPREVDIREVINAIFYITKTSCQWRYLPKDFPDWSTVRRYFDIWKINGTWEKINNTLRGKKINCIILNLFTIESYSISGDFEDENC